MKRYGIYIALLITTLSGCFIDSIKPDELLDYQEKMVVNGVLRTGEPIALQITNSKSAFDPNLPRLVKDADVTVYRNSDVIPLTYDLFSDMYVSSEVIATGDAITVEVLHPDYPNTSSSFRIPDDINASTQLTIDGGIDTSGLVSDLIEISFDDPVASDNYYIVGVSYYNQFTGTYTPIAFPTTDPSLAEYNSFRLNNGMVLFTDEYFDGRTKTISMVPTADLVSDNQSPKYKVELSAVTKDMYEYYRSLQRAEDAKEVTFEAGYNNAVVIHSNVRNGLGLIGGANLNVMILN